MKLNIEKTKAKVAKRFSAWKNLPTPVQQARYKKVSDRLNKIENELVKAQIRTDRLRRIYTVLSWEASEMREFKDGKS